MKRLICTVLILGCATAAADQGFLTKTGKDLAVETKPLGHVNWLAERMVVSGRTMVASSDVRSLTTIMFDDIGTAYATYQSTSREPIAWKISDEAMGNQGNFEFGGWQYLVSQGRVMGIDDSIVKFYNTKIGPPKQRLERTRLTQFGIGGGVGLTADLLWQLATRSMIDVNLIAPVAIGLGAGAGKYLWHIRDDLRNKSHMQLGYEVNWFTKEIARNVEGYKTIPERVGIPPDVELTVRVNGQLTTVRMSELAKDKVRHRTSCIQFLESLKGDVN